VFELLHALIVNKHAGNIIDRAGLNNLYIIEFSYW